MRRALLFSLTLLCVTSINGQSRLTPVAPDLLETDRFRSTGYIESDRYFGTITASGWLVSPSVIVSTGHTFFDRDSLSWHYHTRFWLRRDSDNQPEYRMAYLTRVFTTYSNPSHHSASSTDMFNHDLGVAVLDHLIDDISSIASWDVASDDWAGLFHTRSQMLITGYPIYPEVIPDENRYRMHLTESAAPQWWVGEYPRIGGQVPQFDSWGKPYALLETWGAETTFGSSGGPVWVAHPHSNFNKATAIVLSGYSAIQEGITYYSSLFRILDEAAATFINDTIVDSWDNVNLWPGALNVEYEGIFPRIIFPDGRTDVGHWQLFRNDGSGWVPHENELHGTSYTDTSVSTGTTYIYKARIVHARSGFEEPFSRPLRAVIPGVALELGESVGFDGLFTTGGHASFFPTEEGARSGVIYADEETWLSMEVYGPGTVVFDWSVSSQPDAGEGQPPDALELLIDGKRYSFIAGEVSRRTSSARVAAGPHTLTWKFSKDAVVDNGEDIGTVHSINYIRKPYLTALEASTNVQGGAWWRSDWFGYYHQERPDWMYHPFLGFLYGESKDPNLYLWSMDPELGWLWTAESHYPWVYSYSSGWLYHYIESSWFYREAPAGYIDAAPAGF